MALAQYPQFQLDVHGPFGSRATHTLNAGREGEVLGQVGLVQEDVVDSGLLEGDAVETPSVLSCRLDPFLHPDDGGFEFLDAQAVLLTRLHLGGPVGAHLGLEVIGLRPFGDWYADEGIVGDDDGVPVAGGTPGHEFLPSVSGGGLSGRHQDVGQRIDLEKLGAELFEHVVGDHVGRFGDEAEAFHLHAGHHHGCRLAGTDRMAEQHSGFLHRAPGGVELVAVRNEGR